MIRMACCGAGGRVALCKSIIGPGGLAWGMVLIGVGIVQICDLRWMYLTTTVRLKLEVS